VNKYFTKVFKGGLMRFAILYTGRKEMCLGQCEPFVKSGEAATSFDRSLLQEYNDDIGNVLIIEDTGDRIVVSFPDDMDPKTKDDAHLILEEAFGFD
jgi:hypothetical protein